MHRWPRPSPSKRTSRPPWPTEPRERDAMFQHVEPFAGDPILSLNEDFQRDPRPHKINLSIGIYFDDAGRIPVLDAVRQADAKLLAQSGPKPYLPIEGAANFRTAVHE